MSTSLFSALETLPDDPILGLNELYKKDPRSDKVNLGVGVYLNEEGKLPLQSTVETAESRLVARQTTHGYTAMSGNPLFCDAVQHLVFGESAARTDRRICSVQTLGGTGALHLAALLARECLGVSASVVSNPTWGNHISLFEHAGLQVQRYPYYNAATHSIDRAAFFEYIEGLAPNTLLLLHACCHNPTGADLSKEDWQRVLNTVQEKSLLPMMDIAYQGLGNGLDEDAYAIRLFSDAGVNFMVASSCSKNFGLYGERTGALHVVTQTPGEAEAVLSILKSLVRKEYSNPPAHGANVVTEILTSPELYAAWTAEVDAMRTRIRAMRNALADAAAARGLDLGFVREQNGMFALIGFTPEQMNALREEKGVYAVTNSRICIAGLNSGNVERVAAAIAELA